MNHKKLCVFIMIAVMSLSACCAYADGVKLGMLTPGKLVVGETPSMDAISDIVLWTLYRPGHGVDEISFKFYSNLATMLMALNAGEIDELATSQVVGEYVTALNPDFTVTCAGRMTGTSFVFGFKDGEGEALQKKFNAALADMRKDGTLDAITRQYCGNPGHDKLDSVKMAKFPDAETVRVAVTGDVPPIDFVAADGEAAGFNTAILSEIGKRAKLNIKLVHVETAARTTALMSGRADAIYWYQIYKGVKEQPDAADGVIFSDPYYEFNISLHVGRK